MSYNNSRRERQQVRANTPLERGRSLALLQPEPEAGRSHEFDRRPELRDR